MQNFLAAAFGLTLAACSAGSGSVTSGAFDGEGSSGSKEPKPSDRNSANACDRAAAIIALCPNNLADASFSSSCTTNEKCRATCTIDYPCDHRATIACAAECPADGTGTGTASSGDSSGGSSNHRPECDAYAAKYCGCIPSSASSCVATQTENCDIGWDLSPKQASYFKCITTASCRSWSPCTALLK